jgi:hypothetical protein
MSNYYDCLSQLEDVFFGEVVEAELESTDSTAIMRLITSCFKPFHLQEVRFLWNPKVRCVVRFSQLNLLTFSIIVDKKKMVELTLDLCLKQAVKKITNELKKQTKYFLSTKAETTMKTMLSMLQEKYDDFQLVEQTHDSISFLHQKEEYSLQIETTESRMLFSKDRFMVNLDNNTKKLNDFIESSMKLQNYKMKQRQIVQEFENEEPNLIFKSEDRNGRLYEYPYDEDKVADVLLDYSLKRAKIVVSIRGFYGYKLSSTVPAVDEFTDISSIIYHLHDQDVMNTCF